MLEAEVIGGLFVLVAVVVAIVSLGGSPLPVVGAGRGALLAVAAIGVTGCVVIGISGSAQPGGINPLGGIVQLALWIVVFVVMGAGLFDWDGLLRPVAAVVPGGLVAATTVQLAVAALASLFVVKYVVNIGFALWAR